MNITPTWITASFTLLGTLLGALVQEIPKIIEARRTDRESRRAAQQNVREALISRSSNLTKLCSRLVEDNAQLPGLNDQLPKRTLSEEEFMYIQSDLNEINGAISELEEENHKVRIEIGQEQVAISAEHPRMKASIVKLVKNADFLNPENEKMRDEEILQARANYEKALGEFTDALANEIERLS